MKNECYEFIKGPNNKVSIVGFGSYGQVKLAKNTQTGEMVAIKMIHGRNSKEEIDVHHKLNHSRIIKLLNYYYEKDKNVTYMVLEYAEGGTLHNKIKFGYGQLPKDRAKRYFRDVCKAVEYLHSLKYMHRDIKPQNILITKDDHAKLCDFGFAAILEYRSTLCGTYEYMAPEMIQQKPYDYKVDIWALGILLFELIQGTAPFRGENGQDVINEMKRPIIFSNRFEKEEIELIKKILRVNAENRPTVTAILQHPYLLQVEPKEKQKTEDSSFRVGSSFGGKSSQGLKIEESQKKTHEQPNFQKHSEFKKQAYNQGIKTQTKQFKHFIPQGVKHATGLGTAMRPPVYSTSHQSQPSSTSNSLVEQTVSQNQSSDSSFKQTQHQLPTFLATQKQPVYLPPTNVNPTMANLNGNSINSQQQVRPQTFTSYQPVHNGHHPHQWSRH